MGELMMRGNIIMKGYLKDAAATESAFAGGWFHTGDLGVWHPDGYAEIRDRAKDIIISGGENISTIEVESVLYRHPAVLEAAVVARPDPKWGETPCAFVTLKPGADATEAEIIAFCRERIAHYKAPRTVVFGPLPKTAPGRCRSSCCASVPARWGSNASACLALNTHDTNDDCPWTARIVGLRCRAARQPGARAALRRQHQPGHGNAVQRQVAGRRRPRPPVLSS